jgi:hypothetical protein
MARPTASASAAPKDPIADPFMIWFSLRRRLKAGRARCRFG